MEHEFTQQIQTVLFSDFGEAAEDIYNGPQYSGHELSKK